VTAVFVTSISENAGRTMLVAGLGKSWLNAGKKVGYLKLGVSSGKDKPGGVDGDVVFMQSLLGLQEPAETLVSNSLNLKVDYLRVAQGQDIILMEGQTLGDSKGLPESVDARVLVVHDFAVPLSPALIEYKKIGKRLLGLVLNKVPQSKFSDIRNLAAKEIERSGIKLLGIIPEDRLLAAMSVAELVTAIQGKILNNPENSGDLVENFMLGALAYDSGVDYFQRKNHKAVILKGDRPDMHLAALQTSTRCLVISGGAMPIPMVAIQARDKKVSLISAAGDVLGLAAILESAVSHAKFNQEKKLPRLMEILQENLDLKVLATL
jgi:BioD-like phosphotransacetylase family protein